MGLQGGMEHTLTYMFYKDVAYDTLDKEKQN